MSIECVFEGGPFAGGQLALIGPDFPPPCLLLLENPTGADFPMVVGFSHRDRWEGSERYDLDLTRVSMMVTDEGVSGEAVYVHVE